MWRLCLFLSSAASTESLAVHRRRLIDNGADVGGCCKCPGTSDCYHVTSSCNYASLPCCYGDYTSGSTYYCNWDPPPTMAPTAAPSHSPTMAPTIAPLDAVAPYVLGAFNSNECAADGALIPVTSGNVAFLCEVAVSKLTANSAYPGDLNLPQGSDSTKPRGCSTGGGQAPRTFYSNSGGGTAGALATNGLQTICSVGYAYNVENTNACPLASAVSTVPIRIARSAHCEAARVALGIGGYLKDTNIVNPRPKGCFYNDKAVRRTHARLLSPLDSSLLLWLTLLPRLRAPLTHHICSSTLIRIRESSSTQTPTTDLA